MRIDKKILSPFLYFVNKRRGHNSRFIIGVNFARNANLEYKFQFL